MTCLSLFVFFLMILRPPRSTRTDTLFPYNDALPILEEEHAFVAAYLSGFIPQTAFMVADLGKGDEWFMLQERVIRSEEHTSELQSLMRISYAVFCLTKKIQST